MNKEGILARYKVNKDNGCWEWIGAMSNTGYGIVKHLGKRIGAHRASWIIHFGEINDIKMFVCHKCDNRKCINPDHLFLGTNSDNMRDCYQKGRMVIPEANRFKLGSEPSNKTISNELMKQINEAIENRENKSIKKICEEFNVSYQAVRDSRRKKKRSYYNVNLLLS